MSRLQELDYRGEPYPSTFGLDDCQGERPADYPSGVVSAFSRAIDRENASGLLGDPRTAEQEHAETVALMLHGADQMLKGIAAMLVNEVRGRPPIMHHARSDLSKLHASAGRVLREIEMAYGRDYHPPHVSITGPDLLVSSGGYNVQR